MDGSLWRPGTLELDLNFLLRIPLWVDPRDVERQLLPMLRAARAPERSAVYSWSESLTKECRKRLAGLLPLRIREMEFLNRLNDHGEIEPALLTEDAGMQATLRSHPGLQWKALNVREHRRRRE